MNPYLKCLPAGLFLLCSAGAALGQDALSPAEVMAAMRTQAVVAPPNPQPWLSSRKQTEWPVKGMKLVPWHDSAFRISGELRKSGETHPGNLFGTGNTVTYTRDMRSANAVSVRTCTDAAVLGVFQIGSGYNSRLTVFVDGVRINRVPIEFPPDGNFYVTRVDMGAPGRRCVELLFNNPHFGGVLVAPDAKVWAPGRSRIRAVFMGDSYTEASQHWAMDAAHDLGWNDVWISSVGGTGYINATPPKLNFAERFEADVVAYAPNVLVFAGGINDSTHPVQDIKRAASALFDVTQKRLPNTVVFVMGPWSPRSGIKPTVNAAIKEAAAGRPNFYWVPNYEEHWFTGTGFTKGPKGDGNSDFLIGDDGTHPSERGHEYLASKFAAYVRQFVTGGAQATENGRRTAP